VLLNTGNQRLGALDAIVQYDPSRLEVVSEDGRLYVVKGRDWRAGIFEFVVDPPGVIRFGGALEVRECFMHAGQPARVLRSLPRSARVLRSLPLPWLDSFQASAV